MTIKRHILNLFQSTDDVALGFFTRIGPYVTAAVPALLAGYGIYMEFEEMSPDSLFGPVIGIASGLGFEAAGIKIIHSAIRRSDREDAKNWDTSFVLLVIFSLVFVGLVSFAIFNADNAYPWIVRVVGGISPVLAAMAYFAIGVDRLTEREIENREVREQNKLTVDLKIEEETRLLELEATKARIKAESEAEVERIRAKAEAEKHRLKALADAEAERLHLEAQAKAQADEHQRQIELMKQEQKHEKAMRKMDTTASTSTQGGSKKPFKRYDEFSAFYAETQDISEISRRMSLTPTTVRAYKRKFDAYNEELAALSSSDNSEQKVIETLNGNL